MLARGRAVHAPRYTFSFWSSVATMRLESPLPSRSTNRRHLAGREWGGETTHARRVTSRRGQEACGVQQGGVLGVSLHIGHWIKPGVEPRGGWGEAGGGAQTRIQNGQPVRAAEGAGDEPRMRAPRHWRPDNRCTHGHQQQPLRPSCPRQRRARQKSPQRRLRPSLRLHADAWPAWGPPPHPRPAGGLEGPLRHYEQRAAAGCDREVSVCPAFRSCITHRPLLLTLPCKRRLRASVESRRHRLPHL